MAYLLPIVNIEVANNGDQQEQREEVPRATCISGGGMSLGLCGTAVYLNKHLCKGRHVVYMLRTDC